MLTPKDTATLTAWLKGAAYYEVRSLDRIDLVGNERFQEKTRQRFYFIWEWIMHRYASEVQEQFYQRHGMEALNRRIARVQRTVEKMYGRLVWEARMNYAEARHALKLVRSRISKGNYICVCLWQLLGAKRISGQVYADLIDWIREQLKGHNSLECWLRHERNINSENEIKMLETRKAWIDHMIEVLQD